MAPYSYCLFLLVSAAALHHHNGHVQASPSAIKEACKATRFPITCQLSLTKSGLVPPDPNPFQILRSALSLSSNNVLTAEFMVQDILHHSTSNNNLTTTAELCLETLHHSSYRLTTSMNALQRNRMKDARAWTSAALGYQFNCLSGLKKNNDTQLVAKTLSFMNDMLLTSTSNALSIMMSYEAFGHRTHLWGPPRTERDGFWESVGVGGGSSGHEPRIPRGLKPDVTVCKGAGVCTYETVQMAVNAAPENLAGERRFLILIKEGVYEEVVRIGLAKTNVVLIGDGIGKTVITGSLNVGRLGMATYNTATVGVLGDGFMARDVTIQNTAGPEGHQAVAFRSESDLSVIENCEFIGHQDTLYAHSLRQLYRSCIIKGSVDFIFGNSATIFQNCTILVQRDKSVVSAQGRVDPAQTTGFVFQECVVNGTGSVFLGRPWKEFSRTVFLRCTLEGIVSAEGWMAWDGEFALKTLYFGEFSNVGLGSNLSARVWWSSRIPSGHVNAYSLKNFIQRDEWMLTYS